MHAALVQTAVRFIVATGNVAAVRVAGLRNGNRNTNARLAQVDD